MIVGLASVGLTLLRLAPAFAWPIVTLAGPLGAAAITYLNDSPEHLALHRARRSLRRTRRRALRLHRRVVDDARSADAALARARGRFVACLGPALRRAVHDQALPVAGTEAYIGRLIDRFELRDLDPPTATIVHESDAVMCSWAHVRGRSNASPEPTLSLHRQPRSASASGDGR